MSTDRRWPLVAQRFADRTDPIVSRGTSSTEVLRVRQPGLRRWTRRGRSTRGRSPGLTTHVPRPAAHRDLGALTTGCCVRPASPSASATSLRRQGPTDARDHRPAWALRRTGRSHCAASPRTPSARAGSSAPVAGTAGATADDDEGPESSLADRWVRGPHLTGAQRLGELVRTKTSRTCRPLHSTAQRSIVTIDRCAGVSVASGPVVPHDPVPADRLPCTRPCLGGLPRHRRGAPRPLDEVEVLPCRGRRDQPGVLLTGRSTAS
jgi:hypothetical protein